MSVWWLVRGALLGVAMVVPGLSGGTIALIAGFYTRLIGALARPRPGEILPLAGGVVAGVTAGSHAIGLALATAPAYLAGVLVGVVVAASLFIVHRVGWNRTAPLWFSAGAAAGWAVAGANLGLLMLSWGPLPVVFSGGLVASVAMVLPGISGASLLVMVGQYEIVLGALARWDIPLLAAFVLGAAVGLFTVSRAVTAALARYPEPTFLLLGGMMLGSVRGLWPDRLDAGVGLAVVLGAAAMVLLKGGWGQWKGPDLGPRGGARRS